MSQRIRLVPTMRDLIVIALLCAAIAVAMVATSAAVFWLVMIDFFTAIFTLFQ